MLLTMVVIVEPYYCWYDYVAAVVVSSAGDFIFRDSHDASTRERSLCENKGDITTAIGSLDSTARCTIVLPVLNDSTATFEF
ncbi:hypothetical protein Tco_1020867 [Tanacetum coccineum]